MPKNQPIVTTLDISQAENIKSKIFYPIYETVRSFYGFRLQGFQLMYIQVIW